VQEKAIEAAGLRKSYGPRLVLDSVSFEVEAGSIFALLGPNGAGKTTIIEILEGYRKADGGSARVLGLDPVRNGEQLRPRIGLMLQEGGVYPGIKVAEAVKLFASFYSAPRDAGEILEIAGLSGDADQKVRRLSGGQKQRLNLALALVGDPDLLFLDEPTAGMDLEGRISTWEAITALASKGKTVMFTTHLIEEAQRFAEVVAILAGGKLVAMGNPQELAGGRSLEEAYLDLTSKGGSGGVAAPHGTGLHSPGAAIPPRSGKNA
jgi:ABC-2 type transport system ATP-binding protein